MPIKESFHKVSITNYNSLMSKQFAELNLTFDCVEFKDIETKKNCLAKMDMRCEDESE